MALAEAQAPQADSAGGHSPAGEPSVSSSLEHLMAGGQGVIAKRIDLALLEGQEHLSRTLRRAALVTLGMVLAAGAWFAMAACLVLVLIPNANVVARLAAFGLLNAAGALGLVALAMRVRPPTPARANSDVSSSSEKP